MLTPKDIQEAAFNRVAFGGYDMQAVDELLETVTSDYETLYKENSVLKSKLKVLVEKLEDYREQEISMKRALVAAQQTSDSMIADAQKRANKIVNDAEASAAKRTEAAEIAAQATLRRAETESAAKLAQAQESADSTLAAAGSHAMLTKQALEEEFSAEQNRVDQAKAAAQSFISIVEKELAACNEHLERLRSITASEKKPAQEKENVPVKQEPQVPVEPAPIQEPAPWVRAAAAPAEPEVPVRKKTEFEAVWEAAEQEVTPDTDFDLNSAFADAFGDSTGDATRRSSDFFKF